MAIAVACPGCAGSVSVSPDMAGKRAMCPQCRTQLVLPRTLIESPDRDADFLDEPDAPPPSVRGRLLPWVLGIGAVVGLLALICGGPVGILYMMLRGDREAVALAEQVVVQAPGANLPPGAPPRAQRVAEFAGVFQKKDQLVQGDVVFDPAGRGGKNNSRVCKEYVIDLEAGKNYIITLDAPGVFDAYLRLAQVNGQVIQEDDDSGGNLNSLIRFAPAETKSYLVVATSLGGGFGPYTLTVRESRFKKPR
jgi:hypothetical protein